MTTCLVIVNPASGLGRGRERAEALAAHASADVRVEIAETTGRGSATDIAARRAGDVQRMVAVGGDGTLNEVLAGLMRLGRPAEALPSLGFLPAGTANAAAGALGLDPNPAAVAHALRRGEGRPVDVGIVSHAGGERPFLLWFGAGFDAVIIDTLNASRSGHMGVRGLVRNTPRVLAALRRYPAPEIEVRVDGAAFGPSSSVILPNVGEIAFGRAVASVADPFDGALDVVALPVAGKVRLTRLALAMLSSSLHGAPGVKHTTGVRVELVSQGVVPFQLDGEPVGTLPVDVRLAAGAVRLLRPR